MGKYDIFRYVIVKRRIDRMSLQNYLVVVIDRYLSINHSRPSKQLVMDITGYARHRARDKRFAGVHSWSYVERKLLE